MQNSHANDYIWRILSKTDGVHNLPYPDAPRNETLALASGVPNRVVDIGCGTGAIAENFRKHFGCESLVGCELDPSAAAVASNRLDRVISRPLQDWTEQETQEISTADTILLFDVLEHMTNPWGELEYLCSKIDPAAQILISLPNIGCYPILLDLVSGYWTYKSMGILDITHVRFFTLHEMRRMFYQTGFRIEFETTLSYFNPQNITIFPIELSYGIIKILVNDAEHLRRLHTIQFGFRLRRASDDILSQEELELRYGGHPPTYLPF